MCWGVREIKIFQVGMIIIIDRFVCPGDRVKVVRVYLVGTKLQALTRLRRPSSKRTPESRFGLAARR